MIVSCPACKTRFRGPDDLAAEIPRAVQCGLCGHGWQLSRARPSWAGAWQHLGGFLVVLLAVLAVSAVLLRDPITARYPGLAPLWERIGLPAGKGG